MKTAYLYIRVSTDEQKRKGYSLPEQEDRLLKYCEYNGIVVKGIFREDFSAKNFNRPEWKKLVATIRKESSGEDNILFIKWDRFSRNIEYAYEMISLLRKNNTNVTAIDQPIDFSVPESTVMLAVYLSIPEAENSRRSLNTTNGIRRARQQGRYPHKAPIGFINVTGWDGKKYIEAKHPEAGILKWAFQQLAKNTFKIDEVRKMACAKGLKCSRSYFVKLIRNPVYCGLISLPSDSVEQQTIKGIHTPLISENLFYEVQDIVNTKKKISSKKDEINSMFFLKGFLTCPVCNRKLCGSFSRGCSKIYPYYHCSTKCKVRMRADLLNSNYDKVLRRLRLSNKVAELFSSILQDVNINTNKTGYLQERRFLLKQIDEHESVLSKARKLFIADQLQFDDFKALKKEYNAISGNQKKELDVITVKLQRIDQRFNQSNRAFANIFNGFENLDVADKKQIVSLIIPSHVDMQMDEVSVKLDNALSKILLRKRTSQSIV